MIEYAHTNDVADLDDDQDEPGIHASGLHVPDPWEERNAAFNEQLSLMAAIERIEEHYRELARPLLAVQARNPGVRLPKLVALEQECADKISALEKGTGLPVATPGTPPLQTSEDQLLKYATSA